MASILTEDSFSLVEASKIIPGRPHVNTVRRWATEGIEGVKLRTFRLGGKRLVTRQAVEEFVATLTGKSQADESASSIAHNLAEQKLDELGV